MLRACPIAFLLAACGAPSAPVAAPSNHVTTGDPGPPSALAFTALVPVGKECALERLHIGAPAEPLARFPSSCRGGRIAFTWDTTHCVVWFDPAVAMDDEEAPSGKLFEVTLATKAVHPLPALPGTEPPQMVGYAPDGRLYALLTHDLDQATKQPKVTYLGTPLDFTDIGDGMPAAAVTYRYADGAWALTAVEKTTDGWDYAPTWGASTFAKDLGPETSEYLSPFVETQVVEPQLAAELAKLPAPGDAQPDGDGWQRLPTGSGHHVYAWFITGEFTYSTGLLAWETTPGHVELMPERSADATKTVSVHSLNERPDDHRYLFVATDRAGERPRLYDVVDHTLRFRNDEARAVMPWPAPSKPVAAASGIIDI